MNHSGPPLESLIARIAETPPDFRAEPRTAGVDRNKGTIHVDAVVGDLLARFGSTIPAGDLSCFGSQARPKDQNRLALALLTAWLLADNWFASAGLKPQNVLRALNTVSAGLATTTAARHFYTDPDRREELARSLLAALEFRPAGESEAQALDRLTSVSTAERRRTFDAARDAAERARAIREAIARKAAEESADKMWRE